MSTGYGVSIIGVTYMLVQYFKPVIVVVILLLLSVVLVVSNVSLSCRIQ